VEVRVLLTPLVDYSCRAYLHPTLPMPGCPSQNGCLAAHAPDSTGGCAGTERNRCEQAHLGLHGGLDLHVGCSHSD